MSETDTPPPEPSPALEAEGEGETVGEAKWTALRELERRFPSLDKSSVEFTVLSEGERGLLGVGFVPARVIARVSSPPPVVERQAEPAQAQGDLSPAALRLREVLERVREGLELDASISIRETEDVLAATFAGPELGLVIGRRGQTIDAIQYLAACAVYRGQEERRREIIVDAAGYRQRRRESLETLADRTAARVAATGRSIDLEPMPASERKIVHLRLSDRGDVATASEGNEPNRFVVVRPGD
jgi:spoIIIJ-associated protein